jgi:hypothetical protein
VEAGGFELLAASLRADARDLDVFFDALATKLAGTFPENTTVEREGFRGRGRVRSASSASSWRVSPAVRPRPARNASAGSC